jgi:glutaminyl-tRNA synthetase
VGVTKKDHLIEMALLENCVREDLNENAPRAMAVLDPLKLVLTNYPAGQTEALTVANHPNRSELGEREVPFGAELWIEREDFMEDPPKKFFRLRPGGEVRLRNAYIIRCDEVVKDAAGAVVELRCTYDPDTRSGLPGATRKVKGTIHWVSAAHAVSAPVRTPTPCGSCRRPGWNPPSALRRPVTPSSSSAAAILSPTAWIPGPARRCSTAS